MLQKIFDFNNEHLSPKSIKILHIVQIGLLVFMTLFMLSQAEAQSFWYDELTWTIDFVMHNDFSETTTQLLSTGYNMPLYYYALALIYPIVPYGQTYLLSLSIAFVIIGIVFLYLAAKEIGGEKLGFVALCIACTSAPLMNQCGFELRPYAFFFCFSSMTLLYYFRRYKKENWRNILSFGIAMTFFAYSHHFSMFIIFCYAICDLFMCIKKRIHLKCIVSYLLVIVLVAPWYIVIFATTQRDFTTYWGDLPRLRAPILAIKYLVSGDLYFILFIIASTLLLAVLVWKRQKVKRPDNFILFLICFATIIWTIGVTFVYSRFINPEGSIFVGRYFIGLVPHALLLTALGIKLIESFIKKFVKKNGSLITILLFCAFILIVGTANYKQVFYQQHSINEPFREVATYLSNTEDTQNSDTLIIIADHGMSWIDYYFQKRGLSIPQNILSGADTSFAKCVANGVIYDKTNYVGYDYISNYNLIYVLEKHTLRSEDFKAFLSENYNEIFRNEELHLSLYEKKETTAVTYTS